MLTASRLAPLGMVGTLFQDYRSLSSSLLKGVSVLKLNPYRNSAGLPGCRPCPAPNPAHRMICEKKNATTFEGRGVEVEFFSRLRPLL